MDLIYWVSPHVKACNRKSQLNWHEPQRGWIRLKAVLLLMVFSLLFLGGIFLYYKYEKKSEPSQTFLSYLTQTKNWIFLHHRPTAESKVTVATRANNEPSVHFEFYTALPNMKINAKEVLATETNTKKMIVEKMNQVADIPIKENSKDAIKVITANQIEQELLSSIQPNQYVIQLGFFKKGALAEQYRHSLKRTGLAQNMLKVVTEKQGYRVQVGPFASKTQARIAKIRLQKKGITGIIHVVNNSSPLSIAGKG